MPSALITDPSHPAAAAVRCRLEALGYTVSTGGDLASPEAVRDSVRTTGPVDVLVLSEHRGCGKLLSDSDGREIARVGADSLVSAFQAARHYGALMAERGRGCIIFLSSSHADKPAAADPAYTVAQGAMVMMMKELALHLGNLGVRVNMIQLGPTAEEVEMFDSRISPVDYDAETKIPLHRRASGKDAAGAVAYLISDDAAFVNGAVLRVDGGQNLFYFDRSYSFRREEDLPE